MEETAIYTGGVWEMIAGAGPMVKLVLLILFISSVISWAIIIYKLKLLRRAEKETSAFYELFWKVREFSQVSTLCKNYRTTPLSRLFMGAYDELSHRAEEKGTAQWLGDDMERLERVLRRTAATERDNLERSVNFLATTGTTAPFIGLFGTVWGIMNTFRGIGVTGTASLAVVAPGISEALIATAMGLFAAIPAVVGYNHILTRVDRIGSAMDNFSVDILNIVERETSKKGRPGPSKEA